MDDRKKVIVKYGSVKNRKRKIAVYMKLPSDVGVANEPSTKRRGVGMDRMTDRLIASTQEELENGDFDAAIRLMMLWNCKADLNPSAEVLLLGLIKKKEKKESNVVVRMQDITDTRVKNQTGFPSLLALRGFIAVVCDGDIDVITSSGTALTWFEEWYLYFEVFYGKSVSRWVDVSDKYGLSDACLRPVYNRKLDMVLHVREVWPRYVTYNEDKSY
jgi:hypothetical protein